MAADPLRGLVARALRTEVLELASEHVDTSPLVEIDRIRWRGPQGEGRLLFSRFHEAATVEVQLLPFLSRKGLPVPRVVARGVPPSRAPERRTWLLTEEPDGVVLSRRPDGDAARRAATVLREIQTATANDEPALTALGVPALPASRIRDEALAAVDLLDRHDAARLRERAYALDAVGLEALGVALVHGDYGLRRVRALAGANVVTDWLRAHLGCPLQDLARLCLDLRDRAIEDEALRAFGRGADLLDQAAALQRLFQIRWYAWHAQLAIRSKEDCGQRVRALLDAPSAN